MEKWVGIGVCKSYSICSVSYLDVKSVVLDVWFIFRVWLWGNIMKVIYNVVVGEVIYLSVLFVYIDVMCLV